MCRLCTQKAKEVRDILRVEDGLWKLLVPRMQPLPRLGKELLAALVVEAQEREREC